ncbi:hypothetical protein BJY01DRAFT_209508 [Aspergillus pseudoustus]|uniref:Uncharacterized protein n=1 Tax=Aspergillus pseudoustus TaxID=1810923 RepID=A0ABR4KFF7_9EURO
MQATRNGRGYCPHASLPRRPERTRLCRQLVRARRRVASPLSRRAPPGRRHGFLASDPHRARGCPLPGDRNPCRQCLPVSVLGQTPSRGSTPRD